MKSRRALVEAQLQFIKYPHSQSQEQAPLSWRFWNMLWTGDDVNGDINALMFTCKET